MMYGVVRKLPGLGLGRTPYDETYPLQKYSGTLAGFAATIILAGIPAVPPIVSFIVILTDRVRIEIPTHQIPDAAQRRLGRFGLRVTRV